MQAWVISTVVKTTLKTFEECVRLQTFNRSGYQQIQVDCHYLREPLQNLVGNGAGGEIMLDEVSELTKLDLQLRTRHNEYPQNLHFIQ